MKPHFPLWLLLLLTSVMGAQELQLDLQLRPRAELRHGYRQPLLQGQEAAWLASQRNRLGLSLRQEQLSLRVSLQNVYSWGELPPNAPGSRNGFKLYEAYAEYRPSSQLELKLGRQPLVYDNQRILGLSDWGQAGLSHDALLLRFRPSPSQQLHLGGAFNTEAEALSAQPYRGNSYQNLQFAWYHREFGASGLSLLLLNTGYEQELAPEQWETQYLQTFGAYYRFGGTRWSGNLSAYAQTGERLDREVTAWYAGGQLAYTWPANWQLAAGAEWLSGTGSGSEPGELHSFTPLFGTNHGFNGAMDYFYTGGNHVNSVGLVDVFSKLDYRRGRWQWQLQPHVFWSAARMEGQGSDYLGSELDLVGKYQLHKDALLSFGASQYFGSEQLAQLRPGEHKAVQAWGWVMLSFEPKMVFSKG